MKRVGIFACLICKTALFAGWSPPINVYTDNPTGVAAVGIDANGNAVIGYTWNNGMNENAGATQLIDGVPTNAVAFPAGMDTGAIDGLSISVNDNGNATLLWAENNTTVFADYVRSSSLLNNTWSSVTDLTDRSSKLDQTWSYITK